MSYVIMSTKPKLYHKDIISAAFDTIEKYHLQILSYCRERPQIRNYSKEEIFSDLILPRICRYVENYRAHNIQTLQDLLSSNLAAAQDPELLDYNIKTLNKTITDTTQQINALPKHSNKYEPLLQTLQSTTEQILQLNKLFQLVKIEKEYLAFWRSCVRRTKIKYIQTINSDMNKKFISCDPMNGLASIPAGQTSQSMFEVNELLDKVYLSKEERLILIGVLVENKTFVEVGKEIGFGRMAAARRYQKALAKCQDGLDEVFCVD